jgi:glycogen synthase
MQIGIKSWESLNSIKVGGVAPHVSQLSEALARGDHEVHIFTRNGNFDTYGKIDDVHYPIRAISGSDQSPASPGVRHR